MKTLIIIAALIGLATGAAYGQYDGIGIYSDHPGYTDCMITDIGSNLITVYVVHKQSSGATASRFMIQSGDGFDMVYTGEIQHIPVTFGNSQSGVCIQYGDCLYGDVLLITVHYFAQGYSAVCSWLDAVAEPTAPSGEVELLDCAGLTYYPRTSPLYVNSDGSCGCWIDPGTDGVKKSKTIKRAATDSGSFCYPLPTHETSWGQVKALYRLNVSDRTKA